MAKALKFAHVYGQYVVESFDSLPEAIEAAIYASDMGMESLDYIECEGRKITWNSRVFKEAEEARYARWRAEAEAQPKPTHWILVQDRKGNWAHAEPVTSNTDTAIHNWRSLVGHERVKLRRIKST
jgi:hypothetical protein